MSVSVSRTRLFSNPVDDAAILVTHISLVSRIFD
jgi:hypothetical protein